MKKYNNTKTVIAVSNKSGILVYVVTALMICTSTIYFIAASEDYSELSQSTLSSSSSSTSAENKDEVDTIATVNEMVFFIVVGIAYVAAGIWMLENKYYSKVPYIIAAIGSIALIAFYVSTRTMNIPSIGSQDDIGTIDILSKVMQAAIAGISIYIVRYSTIIWRSATTMATKAQSSLSLPSLAAEILEQEVRKMQKRNENQKRNEEDSSDQWHIKTRHGFEEKELEIDSMIISNSSDVATGRSKIDIRSSSNSNIGNETNNGKTTLSKMLKAQNKHELSKTISLAKKEVKESNVIKVTRSELKPCSNSEIKLYVARLDYLVEKQDDKEQEEEVELKK